MQAIVGKITSRKLHQYVASNCSGRYCTEINQSALNVLLICQSIHTGIIIKDLIEAINGESNHDPFITPTGGVVVTTEDYRYFIFGKTANELDITWQSIIQGYNDAFREVFHHAAAATTIANNAERRHGLLIHTITKGEE